MVRVVFQLRRSLFGCEGSSIAFFGAGRPVPRNDRLLTWCARRRVSAFANASLLFGPITKGTTRRECLCRPAHRFGFQSGIKN